MSLYTNMFVPAPPLRLHPADAGVKLTICQYSGTKVVQIKERTKHFPIKSQKKFDFVGLKVLRCWKKVGWKLNEKHKKGEEESSPVVVFPFVRFFSLFSCIHHNVLSNSSM